jgi:hypothetical protein
LSVLLNNIFWIFVSVFVQRWTRFKESLIIIFHFYNNFCTVVGIVMMRQFRNYLWKLNTKRTNLFGMKIERREFVKKPMNLKWANNCHCHRSSHEKLLFKMWCDSRSYFSLFKPTKENLRSWSWGIVEILDFTEVKFMTLVTEHTQRLNKKKMKILSSFETLFFCCYWDGKRRSWRHFYRLQVKSMKFMFNILYFLEILLIFLILTLSVNAILILQIDLLRIIGFHFKIFYFIYFWWSSTIILRNSTQTASIKNYL